MMTHREGLLAVALCLALPGGAGCGDDDGDTNNNNNNVTGPVCGDGVLDPGELCDDGAQNSDTTPDACRTDCRTAWCGDAVLDSGEECDEGPGNSDLLPAACRRDCLRAHCGDGVVDPGEDCDDGNATDGDGCDAYCEVEPHFECAGSPSTCTCVPYFQGTACDACAVYVDVDQVENTEDGQSWGTAFSRVQSGIDAASEAGPGCEVWVAEGTYWIFEYTILNSVRLRDGVAVYGGFGGTETSRDQRDFAHRPTILDGYNPEGTSVYHVVSAIDTKDATLDGFTIQRGQCFGVDDIDGRGCGVNIKAAIVTIANCNILDNAGIRGGGVASEGSLVTIRDTVIEGNRGRTYGGGLWAHSGGLTLENVTFRNNTVRGEGGGVYLTFGWHSITNSLFEGNTSRGIGGALAILQGRIQVTDTTFRNNSVSVPASEPGYQSSGGAIYWSTPYVSSTFERCSFEGNHASMGGAMYITGDSALTLTDSDFTGNTAFAELDDPAALLYVGGGAIYMETNGTTIDRCRFEANRSVVGGAIRVRELGAVVLDSTFLSNDATFIDIEGTPMGGLGGAVYANGNDMSFESCLFAGNHAEDRGGGLHHDLGPLYVTNCTFAANTADNRGGGLSTFGSATSAVVRNCILWSNTATNGGPQINTFQGALVDVADCLVEGGFAGGTNISTGDPVFVNAAAGDYHLQSTSPAIDVGDDTVAPTTDHDGHSRVDVGGVGTSTSDLGCYEYQP